MDPDINTKKETKPFGLLATNCANLLKVKTLVTLAFVFTNVYAAIQGIELPNEFKILTGSVITYYFTKLEKPETNKGKTEDVQ